MIGIKTHICIFDLYVAMHKNASGYFFTAGISVKNEQLNESHIGAFFFNNIEERNMTFKAICVIFLLDNNEEKMR